MARSLEPGGTAGDTKAPPPPSEPPSRVRRVLSRLVDISLWLAVLGVLFLAVYPKKSGPHVGKPAKTHMLPVVGGGNSEVRTIPGTLQRPLLIEAFASWCGACRRNSGVLSDLKSAQDSGLLDVVAVSVDDHPKNALAAKRSWPIPVDVLHDDSGDFARDYHVDVLPTYILVGVDGRVSKVTAGPPGASDIRAWLQEADSN